MICPQCGQYNEDGARFCGNCGADLSAANATTSAVPMTEAPTQQEYTPGYASQQGYQDPLASTPAASPYDTGMSQPQQPQPTYDPYAQAQPSYDQAPPQPAYDQTQQYAQQPPAPAADPYAQQQYNAGYNQPVEQPKKKFPVLPVVLGVVAVVAVVGGFVLFRNSSSGGGTSTGGTDTGGTPTLTGGDDTGGDDTGGTGTGGTGTGGTDTGGTGTGGTTLSSEWELADTYTDSTYGYTVVIPDNGSIRTTDTDGSVWLYWNEPGYLYIHTYVTDGSAASGDELAESIVASNEDFAMSIVETGTDYAILLGTDPDDGDTNYTVCIMNNGMLYWMDIYYKPADEATMRDVAYAIMSNYQV